MKKKISLYIVAEAEHDLPKVTAEWTLCENIYTAHARHRELTSFDDTPVGIWEATVSDWHLERVG